MLKFNSFTIKNLLIQKLRLRIYFLLKMKPKKKHHLKIPYLELIMTLRHFISQLKKKIKLKMKNKINKKQFKRFNQLTKLK